MNSYLKYAARLSRMSIEMGSVIFSPDTPFKWASGYYMPIYNDNRILLSSRKSRRLIARGFAAAVKREGFSFQVIAGTAISGIPHAAILADLLGLPLVYVREKKKEHGLHNRIEGLPRGADLNGKRVALIEDVISTGGSSIRAVEALREAGAAVPLCLTIFSYDFDTANKRFESLTPPCRIVPLLTYPDLVRIISGSNVLPKEKIDTLKIWHQDPFTWGEKNGFPSENDNGEDT